MTTKSPPRAKRPASRPSESSRKVVRTPQSTVEVVSDSGEGAQKCGQIFGTVCAKMGNGVWTVEIIPAEIEPPARIPAGASGNRIRIGTERVTNWGDRTNLVVAFNEQVLLARHRLDALEEDAVVLLESMWRTHSDEAIQAEWQAAMEELSDLSYRIIEVPMEERCLTVVEDPQRGKNMFALGMLASLYRLDLDLVRDQIAHAFRRKSEEVYRRNVQLLELGVAWAEENLDFQIDVPRKPTDQEMIVMNGNQAVAPATSVSHHLGEVFEKFGGIVHQAEDEIAAAGVAIGASYAGKVAFTITSGPGLALKTEFLGLSVMTEIPLVVVDVQRGGPATGLPTKVEQSDLLASIFGQPGDTPHVVLAPATIEECFHAMVAARRIAEALRTLVIVLTDANLATGVQPFPRPELDPAWQAPPPDLSPAPEGTRPYEWDPRTGLSRRFIPGQPEGMFTLTGLAHDEESHVAYSSDINQRAASMRSRKIAAFQGTLKPPPVYGDDSGDLLVVGWGSTKGAIEEAVDRAHAEGRSVSSLHLTFLSPLEPGIREILGRFKKVMTVEINYSDDPDAPYITEENRRRGQLAWLLRAHTLVDIDSWTRVLGEPLRPGVIHNVIRDNTPEGGSS